MFLKCSKYDMYFLALNYELIHFDHKYNLDVCMVVSHTFDWAIITSYLSQEQRIFVCAYKLPYFNACSASIRMHVTINMSFLGIYNLYVILITDKKVLCKKSVCHFTTSEIARSMFVKNDNLVIHLYKRPGTQVPEVFLNDLSVVVWK